MMDLYETIRIWQKPLIILTKCSILDIKGESRSASDQHQNLDRLFEMVSKYSLKFLSYANTKYECAVIKKVMCNAIFNYCANLVIFAKPEKLVCNN